MSLGRAVHSVVARSKERLDGPERFVRGSFRIVYLALNAPFFREIASLKYLLSDLLF